MSIPIPMILCYNNGKKASEIHTVNGKYHREDGPACIRWYRNGQKESEEYCVNDKSHREDGPARIAWTLTGQIMNELYYIDGHQKSIGYFLEQGFKKNKCKSCNKTYLEK